MSATFSLFSIRTRTAPFSLDIFYSCVYRLFRRVFIYELYITFRYLYCIDDPGCLVIVVGAGTHPISQLCTVPRTEMRNGFINPAYFALLPPWMESLLCLSNLHDVRIQMQNNNCLLFISFSTNGPVIVVRSADNCWAFRAPKKCWPCEYWFIRISARIRKEHVRDLTFGHGSGAKNIIGNKLKWNYN